MDEDACASGRREKIHRRRKRREMRVIEKGLAKLLQYQRLGVRDDTRKDDGGDVVGGKVDEKIRVKA